MAAGNGLRIVGMVMAALNLKAGLLVHIDGLTNDTTAQSRKD